MKDKNKEKLQNIFMALLMIGTVFAVFWITAKEIRNSQGENFSCGYWGENKTECFCGDTFNNGVYEHMQMGEVIGNNFGGDMCCPKSSNLCWEIEQ
jgi:hypothetical protein